MCSFLLWQSAPAPKSEGKEEGEVYVPPKQVELVDIPLKLSEPVRSTTVAPPSRVPEPEPAKKASVAQEGVVKITGGDLPARKHLLPLSDNHIITPPTCPIACLFGPTSWTFVVCMDARRLHRKLDIERTKDRRYYYNVRKGCGVTYALSVSAAPPGKAREAPKEAPKLPFSFPGDHFLQFSA